MQPGDEVMRHKGTEECLPGPTHVIVLRTFFLISAMEMAGFNPLIHDCTEYP